MDKKSRFVTTKLNENNEEQSTITELFKPDEANVLKKYFVQLTDRELYNLILEKKKDLPAHLFERIYCKNFHLIKIPRTSKTNVFLYRRENTLLLTYEKMNEFKNDLLLMMAAESIVNKQNRNDDVNNMKVEVMDENTKNIGETTDENNIWKRQSSIKILSEIRAIIYKIINMYAYDLMKSDYICSDEDAKDELIFRIGVYVSNFDDDTVEMSDVDEFYKVLERYSEQKK